MSRSCRYEPDLNPTYQDMASHYGTAVIPARVRRPQDKDYVSHCTSSVLLETSLRILMPLRCFPLC